MSTRFIKVSSSCDAWDMVHQIAAPVLASIGFPGAGFALDNSATRGAGYDVFRAVRPSNDPATDDALEKLFYNYVSDLGGVLELNTCGADWSGDVYRISIVPASTAGSSAAAGAAPAGSFQYAPAAAADSVQGSEVGAAGSDLVTLRLRRLDVCQIAMALLGVKWDHINEARGLQVDDPRRGVCISSARMWDALHKEVKRQLQEYDARRGCGVDPWEVA